MRFTVSGVWSDSSVAHCRSQLSIDNLLDPQNIARKSSTEHSTKNVGPQIAPFDQLHLSAHAKDKLSVYILNISSNFSLRQYPPMFVPPPLRPLFIKAITCRWVRS